MLMLMLMLQVHAMAMQAVQVVQVVQVVAVALLIVVGGVGGMVVSRWRHGLQGASVPASGSKTLTRMQRAYANKVVWITGASSGIGKATALALAQCGATLILSARGQDALREVIAECTAARQQAKLPIDRPYAFALAFDLAAIAHDAKAAAALVERAASLTETGAIDALINNGGISVRGSFADTLLDVHQRIMDVNYFATIALTQACLPHLLRSYAAGAGTGAGTGAGSVSGTVVAISSVQGLFGLGLRSAYGASKHAVHGCFDSLRIEHAGALHVRVVCPGYVSTNLSRNALTGSGQRWARVDERNAQGLQPEVVGWRIAHAIEGSHDRSSAAPLVIADLKSHLACAFKFVLPSSLENALVKRTRAEQAELQQQQ